MKAPKGDLQRSMSETQERKDTLRVFYDGKPVFSSNGKWLHPLFELEKYLRAHSFQLSLLKVEDTVAGKAAAILLCRMGISSVHVGILSRLGEKVFASNGVKFSYDRLVNRIDCRTEDLLQEVEDFEQAYVLLEKRAKG